MHTDATRTALLRDALTQVAPGIATVRTVPVWNDAAGEQPRRSTLVTLDGPDGGPISEDIEANGAAHQVARELLRDTFPEADWSLTHAYDVHAGELTTLPTEPPATNGDHPTDPQPPPDEPPDEHETAPEPEQRKDAGQ